MAPPSSVRTVQLGGTTVVPPSSSAIAGPRKVKPAGRLRRWTTVASCQPPSQTFRRADLITDALMMAVWRGDRPREPVHYADRGSTRASNARG